MSAYRDAWWDERLQNAGTPKEKINLLHTKILADIARLPEVLRDEACELAARLLENVIDEIQDKTCEELSGGWRHVR